MTLNDAIRPAAENLVLAVIDNHTAVGVPCLLQMLTSVQSAPFATSPPDHLYLLDAVYQVMGIVVHKLSMMPGDFSFPTWFTNSLGPILNVRASCRCCCFVFQFVALSTLRLLSVWLLIYRPLVCFVVHATTSCLVSQTAVNPDISLANRVLLKR